MPYSRSEYTPHSYRSKENDARFFDIPVTSDRIPDSRIVRARITRAERRRSGLY